MQNPALSVLQFSLTDTIAKFLQDKSLAFPNPYKSFLEAPAYHAYHPGVFLLISQTMLCIVGRPLLQNLGHEQNQNLSYHGIPE